ncbi:DNA repair protein rad18 [Delitschia confertaspora ATCC 74209]|uniref:Postreplication repair E3 ubiquitin-protein ligase RAD18 n=1 Tax=Delitschia confertaspora ATCC 74209 TaxID=1513339 RepID=A0A9P4JIY0_9PLEO|nr:DNA repair protein rad18 [Delitschia confertaspora ATCC 74209]
MASFDLPDSTDWLDTSLSSFEPLEAALRCQVCKEFYDTPMITLCSHTFCSLCIRRCITTDGKCPTCKKEGQTDKLMPNWVVGEIVERFVKARPAALELARRDKEEKKGTSGRKRKLDDTDLEDDEISVRSTRSRKTRTAAPAGGADMSDPIAVVNSEEEGDYVPEGMVKCPICQKAMKEEQVYMHLDSCPGQKGPGGRNTRSRTNNAFSNTFQHQSTKLSPSPTPTRLPQLNYSLLKDNALRQKLHSLGIPTWGPKQLLIRRHTEWLNLWNSNCDATHPKTKGQLLKELDVWERTQGGHAGFTEAKVMKKDFDGNKWATNNKDHFDELIANARKKRTAPTEGEEKSEEKKEGVKDAPKVIPVQYSREQPANPPTETLLIPHTERAQEPQTDTKPSVDVARPYEGNNEALAIIRKKVDEANNNSNSSSSAGPQLEGEAPSLRPSEGISNPFSSPSRKVPMFQVPEDPVIEVETKSR